MLTDEEIKNNIDLIKSLFNTNFISINELDAIAKFTKLINKRIKNIKKLKEIYGE